MYAILYHKNCVDGFTAWWIAQRAFKARGHEVKGMAVNYNEPWDANGVPQFIKGYDTLVVDFSFPREYMEGLKVFAKSFLVLDHHETAKEACEGLDYCIFDMTKSGAMLTWEYLHNSPAPQLVRYVQDRDLWKHELEDSRVFNTAIQATEKTLENWDDLHLMMRDNRHVLAAKGHTLIDEVDKDIKHTLNNASLASIGGHIVPINNHGAKYASEAIGALSKGWPFAAGFFMREDGKWTVSLRGSANTNVAQIAKSYGGGGHPGAAGFTIDSVSKLLIVVCSKCPNLASAAFYPQFYCEACSPNKKVLK